ncbi:hypothetical protein [Actinotignum urinale]|uniref:Type II toxin-antitoxin system HicA family toxin n=1 Tax=Actinotignum urinale TaxID=190146 RepID=A0AAW9HV24_9ACTO|nr:hypothetical protein [Actinotignum urinale]MDY5154270.1 hypothetical protein [Actinotignum urinale]MDY5159581.1 hypothetical protein [Actinotignum urinale]
MTDKEVKKWIKELRKHGYKIERTKKNHYKVLDEKGKILDILSSTPSSKNWKQNSETQIRKARRK